MLRRYYLSILFMRFVIVGNSANLIIFMTLSILFMRFYEWAGWPDNLIAASFNSLYEILTKTDFEHEKIAVTFNSLYEIL